MALAKNDLEKEVAEKNYSNSWKKIQDLLMKFKGSDGLFMDLNYFFIKYSHHR